MMYVFEYLVYHLKPYGISTNLVLPLNQSQPAGPAPGTSQSEASKHASGEPEDAEAPAKQTRVDAGGKMGQQGVVKTQSADIKKDDDSRFFKKTYRQTNEIISDAWDSRDQETRRYGNAAAAPGSTTSARSTPVTQTKREDSKEKLRKRTKEAVEETTSLKRQKLNALDKEPQS